MNSKWTNPTRYFGDSLVSALILDKEGDVKKVDRDYFQFAYDSSVLQKTKEIVLTVTLKLKKAPSEALKKRNQNAMAYRKKTQPYGIFSSGCFFRNIGEAERLRAGLPTSSAGYLVDKAGLKGTKSGNFVVSDKHANFIIHKGNGDPKDLVKLLQIIKERVKEKFGVELKEEVVVI
ncbi:hypothetical protein HYW87_01420 [Candidatus Roizmanbacteria bacterium]|nr:hypothetical protein [Candidatus Roizmanbacteria bacterium]